MCGYTSYRDPRLTPPGLDDPYDDEVQGEAEHLCADCTHGEACRRQARIWAEALDGDEDLIRDAPEEALGCEECDLWEEKA